MIPCAEREAATTTNTRDDVKSSSLVQYPRRMITRVPGVEKSKYKDKKKDERQLLLSVLKSELVVGW